MAYSTTIGAVIINLLATVLPLIGVKIGDDQLTNAIQVIIAIATGVWIWYRRVQAGGVTAYGSRR